VCHMRSQWRRGADRQAIERSRLARRAGRAVVRVVRRRPSDFYVWRVPLHIARFTDRRGGNAELRGDSERGSEPGEPGCD